MIEGWLHLPSSIITEEPTPRPRSYHDPHRGLTVEYSASTLSRWGFFPVILRYLQGLRLPQRLQGVTIPSASNAHFKPMDKLMTLVTLFITGIARISHIDRTLAGETALARLLGLDRFPSSDTLYTLLGKVTAWHVKQVDRIHRAYLDEQARFDQGTVIADLDLSVKFARATATAVHARSPFSSVVGLMSLVVCRSPSINAAYQKNAVPINVSLPRTEDRASSRP